MCSITDVLSESVEIRLGNSQTDGSGQPQREVDPFRTELQELRKALGRRIRELRKSKGWSQEAFSDNAHIHRTFAGSLERGEKNVSFHALVLIARCFGSTLAELLRGLEAGEEPKLKGADRQSKLDMERVVLREAANLERTVRTLKELASSPDKRPASGKGRKV